MTLYDEREVVMNNLKTLFGRKIKEYRKKKSLTQAQLAELIAKIKALTPQKNLQSLDTDVSAIMESEGVSFR